MTVVSPFPDRPEIILGVTHLLRADGKPEITHHIQWKDNGPPKMRYEYIKDEDRWIDHAGPITKAEEAEYFEERRKEKERRIRITAKIKTLVVTNKEDIDIDLDLLTKQIFDYQCYTPDCKFVTNTKADYERHVVTKHYGKGLCYPGKIDIKMRGWTAQGCKWEI